MLDEIMAFNIEVTQQLPLWLRLTAADILGHGSAPRTTSSVKKIQDRCSDCRYQLRTKSHTRGPGLFSALTPFLDGQRQATMSDISMAVDNDAFMFTLQMDEPWLAALLSNTCALTEMKGSNKINVVPPTAELELDCRLLPDQDPQQFLSQLIAIINDDSIEITKIMGFTPATSKTAPPL